MSNPAPSAYIVRPGDGNPLKLRTADVRIKASAATSGGVLTCVETRDPPGFLAPAHIHRSSSEAFFVLAGSYKFRIGDDEAECDAGSFVFVPPGVVHGYTAGDVDSRLLIIYLPPGIEEMWREMQVASAESPLTDKERDAIGRRYDIEWLSRTRRDRQC